MRFVFEKKEGGGDTSLLLEPLGCALFKVDLSTFLRWAKITMVGGLFSPCPN